LFWLVKYTDPYIIISKQGATADMSTHTIGFYIDGKFSGGWDYGGTFAHTSGITTTHESKPTGPMSNSDTPSTDLCSRASAPSTLSPALILPLMIASTELSMGPLAFTFNKIKLCKRIEK